MCPTTKNLLPDPTNCLHFIQCRGKNPITMACPKNLYFDPNLEECNYPENIMIPDHYCEYSDMVYQKPHWCDCKKYVLCNYGKPSVIDCPTKMSGFYQINYINSPFSNDFCGCV